MDALDRLEAEKERKLAYYAPAAPPQPRTDLPLELYPITLIGCIRGTDGWHRAGFDHKKQRIVPLEAIR